jgi:hypothetical protein
MAETAVTDDRQANHRRNAFPAISARDPACSDLPDGISGPSLDRETPPPRQVRSAAGKREGIRKQAEASDAPFEMVKRNRWTLFVPPRSSQTAKLKLALHPAQLRIGDGLDHLFQMATDTA